ncbi:MAG: hypothetical protein VW475_06070 [Curvibacter sp.]
MQFAKPEKTPGAFDAPGLVQKLDEPLLLLSQGTEDGRGHLLL